ncbi:conjugal transfer protein TraI, partial [Escherichia coli]|nr:conjugal transfer protein TraI [Escherichia coli]
MQAQRATTGAALVALSLAEKRFEGQALIVEGSEQFRQEIAQLAALHGFNVRFADPLMEQARQAAEAAKQQAPKSQVEQPQASPDA